VFQEELELFTFYFWIFTTKPNTIASTAIIFKQNLKFFQETTDPGLMLLYVVVVLFT